MSREEAEKLIAELNEDQKKALLFELLQISKEQEEGTTWICKTPFLTW